MQFYGLLEQEETVENDSLPNVAYKMGNQWGLYPLSEKKDKIK